MKEKKARPTLALGAGAEAQPGWPHGILGPIGRGGLAGWANHRLGVARKRHSGSCQNN